MSKSEEIDIEKLKHAGTEEFTSRPFLFPEKFDEKKNTTFAYRVKFIEEPRQFTSKAKNTYNCADGLLVEKVNDKRKEIESGKEYTVILHKVLLKGLLAQGKGTITGKTFDFAHRGTRTSKKTGRDYHDYGVMIKEGTLAWSALTRLLPIRE